MSVRGKKTVLTLQSLTEVSDGMGGFTETWTSTRSIEGVLVSSKTITGEKFVADKNGVYADCKFTFDNILSVIVTEKNRFVYQDQERFFNIAFVDSFNNRNYTTVYLKEVK